MKTLTTIRILISVLAVNAGVLWGAPKANPPSATLPVPTPYAVVSRDANSRVWERKVYEPGPAGQAIASKHRYVELATGLNYWSNGQWQESKEEIESFPGGAIARQGQHQVIFANNLATVGAIDMQTPDGKRLRSHILGLSYFDTASGQSVLIAEVKDSIGQLITPNQVLYEDAFTDFKADVHYFYTKTSFEQDIVLRERPPLPEAYGLNSASTVLQVLTEFVAPPQPVIHENQIQMPMGARRDQTMDFGMMKMVRGRAFDMGNSDREAPVAKSWMTLEGRQFLVEEVPVAAVAELLDELPLPPQANLKPSTGSVRHIVSIKRLLPGPPVARSGGGALKVTKLTAPAQGLVLDYLTINSGQTNYVFQADTTYYISGPVNLSGTATIEGGAVLKYAPTNSSSVNCSGTINCPSSAYRPAIFTARDDNSVGEVLSTNNPTGYYAAAALRLNGGTSVTLQNLRFSYALTALALSGGSSNVFSHVQMVSCQNGINATNAGFSLRNALFWNVLTNFGGSNSIGAVEQLTVDTASRLNNNLTLSLTNCLLVAVTNTGTTFTSNSVSMTNNSTGVFLTAGAGAHYLATNSPYRNIGTTNLNPALLSALRKMTTYRPMVYSNITISAATNFTPQAQRDTDTPDLGYHYDPIDYIADLLTITNATLTVTNGTVIASYNRSGIQLQTGSSIVSMGTPLVPNRFVRYQSVQEQSITIGSNAPASALSVNPNHPGTNGPAGTFRFTQFACPAAGGSHLFDAGPTNYNNLLVQDCEFWGGQNTLTGSTNTTATLRNNLFYRSVITAAATNLTSTLNLTNNLVFGGLVSIVQPTNKVWSAFNNDFDSCTITNSRLTNGYNAYLNCNGGLQPTNTHNVVSSSGLAYQAGSLGTFYQPANSPLINFGNTNASLLGLYHFTTQTNQVKETNSTVDIGYHYVALNPQLSTLNPVDSNGDGIPDYLQDANGNGLVDAGETNWGLAILTQPVSQVVPQGTNVTFSVTAGGIAPLRYQWLFNTTNKLAGATNTSLTLTNVQTTNAGNYSVVVTNLMGSVTSSIAALTVNVRPTITQQPASQMAIVGSTATFLVTASGSPPLNYQWYSNGTNVLAGATNATLILANVQTTNAGTYTVVVTNVAGSANSSNAWLDVETCFSSVDISMVIDRSSSMSNTNSDNMQKLLAVRIASTNFVQNLNFSNDQAALFSFNNIVTTNQLLTNSLTVLLQGIGSITSPSGNTYMSNALQSAQAELVSPRHHSYALPVMVFLSDGRPTDDSNSVLNVATQVKAAGTRLITVAFGTDADTTFLRLMATSTNDYYYANTFSQLTNVYSLIASSICRGNTNIAPIITQQPTNQTVLQGSNATFTVTATGTPNPNYQWRFNITNILAGATNASLTLTNVQMTNAGNYSVVVTNVAGSVTSPNATLTVIVPPAITGQPTNVTVCAGYSAGFCVTVTGSSLNYQWRFNGTNISGATGSCYTLTNVQPNLAGNYSVAVTNVAGSVTSSNAVLTVNVAPGITGQPTNQMVCAGSSAGFCVTATGSPLNYQWLLNGTNLSGATSSCYTLTNVQPNRAGIYSVVVANSCGWVFSSQAVLTVNVAPAITGQPTNVTVCAETPAGFCVTATGSPLNYQWRFNGTNIAGATGGCYTLTNAQTTNAGIYTVVISNSCGTVTSSNAVLTVNVPPLITQQPVNVTTNVGRSATFSVTVTGTQPLSYQWYFNSGVPLPNATNAVLTLTNVQRNQAGIYSVVVSNVIGSVNSSYAVLRVWTPSGVIAWGDNTYGQVNVPSSLTNAVAIAGGSQHNLALKSDGTVVGWGRNTFGSTNVPLDLTNAVAIAAGQYFSLALKSDGTVVAWGWNNYGQTNVPVGLMNVVAIAAGGYTSLALKNDGTVVAWGYNVNGQTNVPNGLTNVVAIATGGTHCLALKSDGTMVGWGDNTYGETGGPTHVTILAIAAGAYESMELLNVNNGIVTCWGQNALGQNLVPAGLTTVVAIAMGGDNSLVLESNGTVVVWGYNGYGQTNVPAGLTNVVAIAAGGSTILALGNLPPIITQQPVNVTTNVGGTATFSVTVSASSTLPLSYQWYFNTGVLTNLLTNATSATLTLTNVQPNQAGNYSVTVTNVAGSVTSSNAVLVVMAVSPVKVNPGTNQTVVLNNTSVTITLNGSVSAGCLTVTSLWTQAAGPAMAQFTNATSTNAVVHFTVAGNYLLRLMAGDGYSSDSGTVIISVVNNQSPVVNAGPNRIIAPSNTAFLNGSVTDDGLPSPPSLSSWWSVVSQPTNASLVFSNRYSPATLATNLTVQGLYTLRLTATDCLATNSSDMTVTVADPSSRTYTFDADFAEGELVNVNFDVPDQLQLNQTITPFPYVWIACTARGTIVRIDANTGQILGEYRTTPEPVTRGAPAIYTSPSRTTVDKYGNVWVANRYDNLGGTNGSITRVGLVIGGTRGAKITNVFDDTWTFQPDPQGEYLQPPFKYCTAVDRDGDGYIHTSSGLGNFLGWDSLSSGDNNSGGVSLADDECIINYTRVDCTATRTIAIDANNDLWVGGWNNYHEKINGITGQPVPNTLFNPQMGGYGGLIDGSGVLWSAHPLFRFDIARRFDMTVNPPVVIDPTYTGDYVRDIYGISIDPQTGYIWFSRPDSGDGGGWVNPADLSVSNFHYQCYLPRGIAVDDNGGVWIANSGSTTVSHARNDGTFVGLVNLGCGNSAPTGVAIDSNGKVWAACMNSGTAVRIDPKRGPHMLNNVPNPAGYFLGEVDLTVNLGAGSGPYNYSDMTGFVSLGATEPSGIWRVVHDSGIPNEMWGVVGWTAANPPGTSIKVEVRASDDYLQLSATNNLFQQVTNRVPFTNMTGRFVEIRSTFSHKPGTNATSVLYDLTVSSGTNAVVANLANFANSDRVTIFENSGPVVINVLSNDVAPAGSNLTITKVSPPANGYVTIGTNSTNLIYTPNTNFYGLDRFSYTAADGQGGFGRAVVTVLVGQQMPPLQPTNAIAPTAGNTNIVLNENSPEIFVDVISICNPSTSSLVSVTQGAHGFVRIVSASYIGCKTGVYYMPEPGFAGTDHFTYTINSQGLTASATVTVVVNPPIPIACSDSFVNIPLAHNNSGVSLHDFARVSQIYTFAGSPVQSNTVTLSLPLNVYFSLYDPMGQYVGGGAGVGSVNVLSYLPRTNGTYTIEVSMAATSSAQTYAISMDCTDALSPIMGVMIGTNALPCGSSIDFGVTMLGQPVAVNLTITNLGSTNLNVWDASFKSSGNLNGSFTVTNTTLTYSHSIIVPVHGSSNLTVRFQASSLGQTNDVLRFTADDVNYHGTPYVHVFYNINLTGRANLTNPAPPTVAITSPLANATFFAHDVYCSGYIPITAHATTAAPGASIYEVDIYARTGNGNIVLLTPGGAEPVGQGNYTWDYWTSVPPDSYQLTAVAIDSFGVQAVSDPVPITELWSRTNSPIMNVLLGTNMLHNGSTINLGLVPINLAVTNTLVITNASATNLTLTVTPPGSDGPFYLANAPQTQFTLGGHRSTNLTLVFISDAPSSSPETDYFTISSDAENGETACGECDIKLTAIAIGSGTPPIVALTNPATNTLFVIPTNVPLVATATASSGHSIQSVYFYVESPDGNTNLTYNDHSSSGIYSNIWQNVPAGHYILTAVAIDNAGVAAVSDGVPITVLDRPTNSPVMRVFLFQTNALANHSTIDYGVTTVGTPTTASLTISNAGNAVLNISKLILSNTNDFSLACNFDLSEQPLSLPAGSSTNFGLLYNAKAPGQVQNVLTIYDNDVASHPFCITNVARANPATNARPPTVRLTAPVDGSQYAFPADITVTAVTGCATNSTLWGVNFFTASPTGNVQIGQILAAPGQTSLTNSFTWTRPAPGTYSLNAIAINSSGLMTQSTNHVVIQVIDPNAGSTNSPTTNAAPIARDDLFIFQGTVSNSITYPLNVLANDSDPNGDPLTLVGFADPHSDMGTFAQQGNRILFTLRPLWYGTNYLNYEITDGRGNYRLAWATIIVIKGQVPIVNLVSPTSGYIILLTNMADRYLPLTAYASDPNTNGSIARVTFYDSTNIIGYATTTNGDSSYTFTWRTPPAGRHWITAIAQDNIGLENISQMADITIAGKPGNTPPTAVITSPVAVPFTGPGINTQIYPTVTNGTINISGTANDSDAGDTVGYQLLLCRPDGTVVANLTPNADPTSGYRTNRVNGILATNADLSLYENGAYDIVLNVFDGWEVSSASVTILLNTQLKIGQFSFSVQDLVLPVGGIPLTVTRTYNSFNLYQGDFGYSWTYAINDVNLQLDEDREMTSEVDTDDRFSIRVGGGRDVTLTLPDGRRVTFQFYFDGPHGYNYDAAWHAPRGVNYKLTAYDANASGNNNIPFYDGFNRCWNRESGTGFDSYDFPEFILTAPDGTQFRITREDEYDHFYGSGDDGGLSDNEFYVHTYGKATLAEIIQRSGDSIQISPDRIDHYAAGPNGTTSTNLTRSITFDRDSQNRITAVYDPNSLSNNPSSTYPSIRYTYDSAGNLINVRRLLDRATGQYALVTYQYTNSHFPHFITGIIDPRGVGVAKTYYDDTGRVIAVDDADGKKTQFIHSLTNNTEIIVDRLGHTNTYVYDLRGNVTNVINALGGITFMAYDPSNNKTNEIIFLNGQRYATNRYVYDMNNLLLASTDSLGHANGFTYGQNARLETSTDARGNSTTNYYDNNTDNLTGTSDAMGNTTSNFYSASLLVGSRDAIGTITTNYYDNFGNLTRSAILSPQLSTLSSNTFAYDANGNRTNSTVWSRPSGMGGSWTNATTTYIYDAQNRVTQTIDPDGGSNTVVYNNIGKQQAAIDKLGRTTTYDYDNQGRLWRTTYPDLTAEISVFDANGNRTNSVDRAGRATTYVCDALNRVTNTIYADLTTSTTVYDGVGRVARTIDARGTITAFAYDATGRRLAVTNAVGITNLQTVSSYSYDANGNQFTFTDALSHVTTNFYDALNRQTNISFADGTRQITVYDGVGRRIAQTDQATNTTGFAYDGLGRLTVVTNALGKLTQFQYDEAGNQTAQMDALSRTTTFEYDSMGRRTKRTLPGTQFETLGYDPAGNLIFYTTFNGVIITNQYDVMNRLTNRTSINGYQISYAYTLTGQRQTMADASGTQNYAYDARDRLLTNATPVGTLSYQYDENGNVTNITSSTANGTLVTYQYDALNRLTNVVDARLTGTNNTAYHFDAVGNLRNYTYPNGVTNLYQYDSLNRLTSLTWKLTTAALGDFSYQLGLSGNRTNLIETVAGVSRTNRWAYDPLYRLANEVLLAASGSGTNAYTYDDVGNRLTRTTNGFTTPFTAPTNQTFNFDKSDRLDNDNNPDTASTLFDANGNTTNYAGTFRYDVENRLTNANNGAVIIVYNGDGLRVKKITSTKTNLYLIDTRNPSGYAQVLEELTVAGATTNLSCAYTYGLNLISQRQPGVTTNFYGYDGQGSVRFLLTLAGSVTNNYVYDAYGMLLNSTGTIPNNYRYCGEQFDADLGFYYLRSRYFDPNIGRFQTMDSFEGNNSDPLSLHKYLYCHGNPVNNTDPSGRAVYVMTRPLNIKGFENMGNSACHVFLAFDTDGMDNLGAWEDAVNESMDATKHPNTYGIPYYGEPDNVTFSFHPKSVWNGDETDEYFGTVLTPSTYVAFEDNIDMKALSKTGTGYNRWLVAKGQDLQMRIYKEAVRSRDKNNNGTPDPMPYEWTVFNCGSWVDYILAGQGIAFPNKNINNGVGIANSGTAASTGGYAINAAARIVRWTIETMGKLAGDGSGILVP